MTGRLFIHETNKGRTGKMSLPIVCNLNALTPKDRERHGEVTEQLRTLVRERREEVNGFSFRIATDASAIMTVSEFITRERLCCPFLDFSLKVISENGEVWLSMTGKERVKEFLIAELNMKEAR